MVSRSILRGYRRHNSPDPPRVTPWVHAWRKLLAVLWYSCQWRAFVTSASRQRRGSLRLLSILLRSLNPNRPISWIIEVRLARKAKSLASDTGRRLQLFDPPQPEGPQLSPETEVVEDCVARRWLHGTCRPCDMKMNERMQGAEEKDAGGDTALLRYL